MKMQARYLKDKAEEYAQRILKEQKDQIVQAYIDGYFLAKENYSSEPSIDLHGLKWYNLNLPSGNLWSEPIYEDMDYFAYPRPAFNYRSVRYKNLPTLDDLHELSKYTRRSKDGKCLISENSCEYTLDSAYKYWLKSDIVDQEAYVFNSDLSYHREFVGERHAVVFVRQKDSMYPYFEDEPF